MRMGKNLARSYTNECRFYILEKKTLIGSSGERRSKPGGEKKELFEPWEVLVGIPTQIIPGGGRRGRETNTFR